MIDIEIIREVNFFLYAFMAGIISVTVYDLIRTLRRRKRRSVWRVCVTDFIYWIAAAIAMSVLCFYKNDGQMRFFAIAAYALGMLFYLFTLSDAVLTVTMWIQRKICAIGNGILNFFKNFFQIILRKK